MGLFCNCSVGFCNRTLFDLPLLTDTVFWYTLIYFLQRVFTSCNQDHQVSIFRATQHVHEPSWLLTDRDCICSYLFLSPHLLLPLLFIDVYFVIIPSTSNLLWHLIYAASVLIVLVANFIAEWVTSLANYSIERKHVMSVLFQILRRLVQVLHDVVM